MIYFITFIILFTNISLLQAQEPMPEVKAGNSPQITITFAQKRLSDLDVTDIRYKLDDEEGSLGMALACKQFINPDGSLGEWGKELVKAIARVGQDCFKSIADYSVLCPNYGTFGKSKQWQFIVFLFAAKAFQESSCEPDKVGTGIGNGAPVGLFQLEDDNQVRKSNQRDPTFCSPGVPNKSKEIKFQMECGAAIFRDGYCKKSTKADIEPSGKNGLRLIGAPSVDNNYYWQELNSYGDAKELPRIVQRVQRFPGCSGKVD